MLKRTASDKLLHNKAFNPKYDGYQRGLASTVYNCFDRKSSVNVIKSEIMSNKQLGKELHKPNIRKVKKRRVYSCVVCYLLLIFILIIHVLLL